MAVAVLPEVSTQPAPALLRRLKPDRMRQREWTGGVQTALETRSGGCSAA